MTVVCRHQIARLSFSRSHKRIFIYPLPMQLVARFSLHTHTVTGDCARHYPVHQRARVEVIVCIVSIPFRPLACLALGRKFKNFPLPTNKTDIFKTFSTTQLAYWTVEHHQLLEQSSLTPPRIRLKIVMKYYSARKKNRNGDHDF